MNYQHQRPTPIDHTMLVVQAGDDVIAAIVRLR